MPVTNAIFAELASEEDYHHGDEYEGDYAHQEYAYRDHDVLFCAVTGSGSGFRSGCEDGTCTGNNGVL